MGNHFSTVTQKQVSQAVAAFEHVHLRKPSIRHLVKMLHTAPQTIMKFERTCSPLERLSKRYVEAARELDVPTREEVNAMKQAAAKAPRKRMREAKLQASIERVVSKSLSSLATVDFVHDNRHHFRGRMRVTRIG